MTSVNSRRPSVRKRLVTQPFGNGFSVITLLFFVVDRKNSIFGISEFFYWSLYANFQFSWSCDHFLAPFGGLHLPNAWSQTLQTSKRHTFTASAFHRYYLFGLKLFPVGCAQDTGRYLKCEKMLFFDLAPPTLQNSRIFHDSTRPHLL